MAMLIIMVAVFALALAFAGCDVADIDDLEPVEDPMMPEPVEPEPVQ